LKAVRSEVSLSIKVLTMPDPIAQRAFDRVGHQGFAAGGAMDVAPHKPHLAQRALAHFLQGLLQGKFPLRVWMPQRSSKVWVGM
jgi:hypothetical protein